MKSITSILSVNLPESGQSLFPRRIRPSILFLDVVVIVVPVIFYLREYARLSASGAGIMEFWIMSKLQCFLAMAVWMPYRTAILCYQLRTETRLRRDLALTPTSPAAYLSSRLWPAIFAATGPLWVVLPIDIAMALRPGIMHATPLVPVEQPAWWLVVLTLSCELLCVACYALHATVSLRIAFPIQMHFGKYCAWQAVWLAAAGVLGLVFFAMSLRIMIGSRGSLPSFTIPLILLGASGLLMSAVRRLRESIPDVFPTDEVASPLSVK